MCDKDNQREKEIEDRIFYRLHHSMKYFHDHFAEQFFDIYKYADCFQSKDYTLNEFIRYSLSFTSFLHKHHSIEESFLFPLLAKKMPAFAKDRPDEHAAIFAKVQHYDDYLKECKRNEGLYDPKKLREIMDTFKDILFHHMNAELECLEGGNMKRYWTKEELLNFPF
eukprot:TRINITY_DN3439_c0_g1_i1.p1 TRINITY_DN3439_c0_g1~~TRINITY_DN3439_c0_g1_i1.p1  ORF type:complete len:167 (-),score=30.02 TRINITY_DN3439_c0_g1_i1:249-749(-)